ncbi:MAG: guanylate kinase [Edaphobacter sp.]|uniref:guanylate kinase n=1 Tax=Edaphobacter sp. TaxID=1934404 RepID=UPI00239706AF|nr:guanylate kinase [Edaphobacter sp.]MDE1177591.1 guanylate kinase [Edaphobacter sp.]
MAGILFIISAPSGSGKSTLVTQLRTLVEGLDFSISYTTRAPRGSEEHAREYYFTTRAEFERMIAAGEFLEWAEVFGNYYGTAVSALLHAKDLGKDLLLDIDVQGALQVMKKMPEAVSIFILPPSPQILEMRLRNRSAAENMTSEAIIEKRLNAAKHELKQVFDYRYALVNDVLDKAVAEMRAIVLYERGTGDDLRELAQACRTDTHTTALASVLTAFGEN